MPCASKPVTKVARFPLKTVLPRDAQKGWGVKLRNKFAIWWDRQFSPVPNAAGFLQSFSKVTGRLSAVKFDNKDALNS